RNGTTLLSAVVAVSVSNTAFAIIRPGAERAEVVGLRPSPSASSPYRKVPPLTGSGTVSGGSVSTIGPSDEEDDSSAGAAVVAGGCLGEGCPHAAAPRGGG